MTETGCAMQDNAAALKCELAADVLRTSGKLLLGVTGQSMLPTVWPGDTLVIERAGIDAVSEGDLILFGRNRRFFAHRVVKKGMHGRSEVVTRGDSMPQADPPVSESEVLGKISFILRSGKCIRPTSTLRFRERAVAALVWRSRIAARVVVGVHGLRQTN